MVTKSLEIMEVAGFDRSAANTSGRPLPLVPAWLVLCLAIGRAATAQSLDYRDFEGMFDEPVTISATGKPERVSDTAVIMDIITADDIARSGARDLASLLRMLPGIQNYFGYNGTQSYSIGSLLLNGREVYLAAFAQSFLGSIPVELEEIRQIEVIRGPQTALYGFNAGQGVINIITFDPSEDPINLVRGRLGNDARRDGAAIATFPLATGMAIRLTADDDHAHDLGEEPPPGNHVPATNPDRKEFSARFAAHLPDGDSASAEVTHSDVASRQIIPQIDQLYALRLISDSVQGDVSAESAIGNLTGFLSYTSLKVPEAVTQESGWFALEDRNLDARVSDLRQIDPEDNIRATLEARDERVHTSISLAPIDTRSIAGSTMWEHRWSAELSMVNAFRIGDFVTEQNAGNADGGKYARTLRVVADNSDVIYRPDPDDSLRGSFARGVNLPSTLDVTQLGLTGGAGTKTTLAGSTDLQTTPDLDYRASWDHSFRPWATTLRVTLFDQQNVNALNLLPINYLELFLPACARPTPALAATCTALAHDPGLSGSTLGLDTSIDHQSRDGWTWGVSFSAAHIHPHMINAVEPLVPQLGETETTRKIGGKIGYGWQDWRVDLRLLHVSPVQSLLLEANPLPKAVLASNPAATILSPHLTWFPRDNLEIDLAADNLWAYRENLAQRVPASAFVSVKVSY